MGSFIFFAERFFGLMIELAAITVVDFIIVDFIEEAFQMHHFKDSSFSDLLFVPTL